MPLSKIRRGTFTIPVEIRREASLEDGTLISVEYDSDKGVIILKPEVSTDGEEYVTLSTKGKAMIEEALEAERNGEVVGPFSNTEDAIKALKEG